MDFMDVQLCYNDEEDRNRLENTAKAVVGSNDQGEKKAEEATNGIVGLQGITEEVLEQLTRGSTQLKIVSLVGMPGLGKTTLASLLYGHPSVKIHFHVLAWCCISQVFDKKTLLNEIFNQIVGKNQLHKIHGQDIVEKLYQSLKGKRYLIVIDDIWDIEAWNGLKETFPNDDNGSRILFTTRNRDVALHADCLPIDLRLLSKDESRELLHMKLFEKEPCPDDLRIITKHIAEKCKGLPLAVILIAGVLKRAERKKDSWEQVAQSLIWSNEVEGILEFSYKVLPDYLKPCFLYFGSFPEDKVISVSKLIQLWVSEGFVGQLNSGQKCLEQAADDYLKDLIDRSLVMIVKRTSKGGVKACRVHDILRDFCLAKAKKEIFTVHDNGYEHFKFTWDWEDSEEDDRNCLYRLCTRSIDRMTISYGFRLRSLLYYGKLNMPSVPRDGDYIYKTVGQDTQPIPIMSATYFNGKNLWDDLNLLLNCCCNLQVLDLEKIVFPSGANTKDYFLPISQSVRLRYLAVRVCTYEIPSAIWNLKNLETLLLSGAIGRIMLPEAIWYLPKLRHIHSTNYAYFSFQWCSTKSFESTPQLDNLQTISFVSLQYGVEKILSRLCNLRKLGCRFLNSKDDSTNCNDFPVLNFLTQLESLKVFFSGKAVLYPCTFHFPAQLKKLTMSSFRLPWDEISVIGRMLPNLEVLKLLNRAFEGKQWGMKEGDFPKLRFLKLDSLDIEVWDVEDEALPCLQQIVVVNCEHLEEIPSAIGAISTLELIELKWCSPSATDSVKQILEEQLDMSNDQLKVNVVGP